MLTVAPQSQLGSKLFVATFFSGVLFYQFLVPGKGEQSAVYDLINKYTSRAKDWEEINALHTKAAQQASFDRNLFQHGSYDRHRWVDVTFPECVLPSTPPARLLRAG